jgi:hypothetical protein
VVGHAITVDTDSDGLTVIRCTCGEHASGRSVEILEAWASMHLREATWTDAPDTPVARPASA